LLEQLIKKVGLILKKSIDIRYRSFSKSGICSRPHPDTRPAESPKGDPSSPTLYLYLRRTGLAPMSLKLGIFVVMIAWSADRVQQNFRNIEA
jgi:hypothetical protein